MGLSSQGELPGGGGVCSGPGNRERLESLSGRYPLWAGEPDEGGTCSVLGLGLELGEGESACEERAMMLGKGSGQAEGPLTTANECDRFFGHEDLARVTLSQRRHARLATSGCVVCAEHLIANAVVNGLLAPLSMGLSLTGI